MSQWCEWRPSRGCESLGQPNSFARQFDFWDDRFEGRRLFSELLGTFLLVLVAVGGGMVNARFGGNAVPYSARVVAPGLMVAAIILFMGAVGGAHLNPAVSIAFVARGQLSRGSEYRLRAGPVARGDPGHPVAVGA